MHTKDLLLRAYVKQDGNVWYACCLEYTLAVQASTCDEAKRKLVEQIKQYVTDALTGEDIDHAHKLLTRRAPPSEWIMYYWILFSNKLLHIGHGLFAFRPSVPLIPV